jgi:hypothetical protein
MVWTTAHRGSHRAPPGRRECTTTVVVVELVDDELVEEVVDGRGSVAVVVDVGVVDVDVDGEGGTVVVEVGPPRSVVGVVASHGVVVVGPAA